MPSPTSKKKLPLTVPVARSYRTVSAETEILQGCGECGSTVPAKDWWTHQRWHEKLQAALRGL